MELKIRTDEEIESYDSCELYDSNDKLIGIVKSGLSLTDICVQIKKNNIEGCYIKFKDEKIEITNTGRILPERIIEMPFRSLGILLRKLI